MAPTDPREFADDEDDGAVVEHGVSFTLVQLCEAVHAERTQLMALVQEGVIEPSGSAPDDWRFGGASYARARTAVRLTHDLQLDTPAVALVLDLLDEIASLRGRLRRLGAAPD
jgi:chaperone modulatory protein CbpM